MVQAYGQLTELVNPQVPSHRWLIDLSRVSSSEPYSSIWCIFPFLGFPGWTVIHQYQEVRRAWQSSNWMYRPWRQAHFGKAWTLKSRNGNSGQHIVDRMPKSSNAVWKVRRHSRKTKQLTARNKDTDSHNQRESVKLLSADTSRLQFSVYVLFVACSIEEHHTPYESKDRYIERCLPEEVVSDRPRGNTAF